MGKPCRVLLVEDHRILREGLKAVLTSDPEIEVVGEAEDGREAVRAAERLAPDVVILDLTLPRTSGLDAIAEIRERCPRAKIVVLTAHKAEDLVLSALREGAHAYVLKEASLEELTAAVHRVRDGHRYLSPEVTGFVVERSLAGGEGGEPASAFETLTPREREILKLVAEGYRNREIAEYLCISLRTVETHRARLMKKLGVENTAALTTYALEKGLVAR
ncbi:MAG: DNA-binding response regulator [Candidatus Dadabacteria bacterium]|nr:MAG: DNA-binding response regulator [Candidatus Dadabacteria bacterium]